MKTIKTIPPANVEPQSSDMQLTDIKEWLRIDIECTHKKNL